MNTILYPLPAGVKSFVCETEGETTILLNANLTREQNQISYLHELAHIENSDLRSSLPVNALEELRHK